MASEKQVEVVTLGRPFHLGMLYDMRSDSLITGVTLWNPKKLENNTKINKQPSTDYEIITGDSFENKAHALGIEASLKLSLLGGLINSAGSAKYADDHQKTNHATRLTLKYSTTTHFEQLTMDHLGKGKLDYPDLHDRNLATHVVTGVVYGAEAFFVFDRTLSTNESKNEIHGALKVMINKIPKFQNEGEAKLDLTDNEKRFLDNLNCKFYSDFSLSENPSTFEEAVKLYRQLPSRLGQNNENAVPKKVWLYPLHLLDGKDMRIVRQISSNLTDQLIAVLEDYHSLKVKASDLRRNMILTHFSDMKKPLSDFVDRLDELQRDLKEQIGKLLPQLRGAVSNEESKLFDVLKQLDLSPFKKQDLELWLKRKENLVALTTSFVESLTKDRDLNITVESSSRSNIIADMTHPRIFCLSFRFNDENEYLLEDMYNYRYKNQTSKSEENRQNLKPWFEDGQIKGQIHAHIERFKEFAAANSTITNGSNKFVVNEGYWRDSNKRVKVILYENGSEKEIFIFPVKAACGGNICSKCKLCIDWSYYGNLTNDLEQLRNRQSDNIVNKNRWHRHPNATCIADVDDLVGVVGVHTADVVEFIFYSIICIIGSTVLCISALIFLPIFFIVYFISTFIFLLLHFFRNFHFRGAGGAIYRYTRAFYRWQRFNYLKGRQLRDLERQELIYDVSSDDRLGADHAVNIDPNLVNRAAIVDHLCRCG
ncbi:unnamed protein product [Adineta steineri]|uniref:SNTX thioredoxin-like domain-containing protein n=1 Tax=Adineta steineri TaxID=433720 RepID=A0A815SFF7_9BILA|nr:unnamed protein product [Adineta steineri]CAF4175375.1 unnamed protein product [Adineta steineri]